MASEQAKKAAEPFRLYALNIALAASNRQESELRSTTNALIETIAEALDRFAGDKNNRH